MRVGALCAGYGGLELALGHDPVWVAETDPHAAKVLDARWPDAPNLGDLTRISDPPPVDVITAGFPCQPVSIAGKRAGVHDERWLFDDIVDVVRRSGARTVVLENVLGLLTANNGDALGRVCSALASIGFDADWATVRASDVGAPHRRTRWFCVAYPGGGGGRGPWTGPGEGGPPRVGGDGPRHDSRAATPDADGAGLERHREPGQRPGKQSPASGREPVADTDNGRRRRPLNRNHPQISELQTGVDAGGPDLPGPFGAAIDRWAAVIGRPAPPPTVDGRLNPRFVEWMMGLPAGWVTDIIPARSHALRVLGNGVVPQQAAHAVALLSHRPATV